MEIEFLLKKAILSISINDLDSAKETLDLALIKDPSNSEVNRIMGLCNYFKGDLELSLEYLDRAIELNTKNSNAYNNKATILSDQGKYDQAIKLYEKSIHYDNKNHETFNNLGNLYQKIKKYNDSINCYLNALKLNPSFAYAYNNLGNVQKKISLADEAINSYRTAIGLKIDYVEARCNLASLLIEMRRDDEAHYWIEESLKINPNSSEALNAYGNLCQSKKSFEQAINFYNKAILIKPDFAEAYCNLANTYIELKEFDRAIIIFERALSINKTAEGYTGIGRILSIKNNSKMAYQYFHQALQVDSEWPEANLNLAFEYLKNLDFNNGWNFYEWRLKEKQSKFSKLITNKPLWDGNIQEKKKVLICGEQGIGDQILYGSILADLEDSKSEFTIQLDQKLINIFKRSFPNFNFISRNSDINNSDYESYIYLGSLGKFFRNEVNDFKKSKSFLKSDKEKKYVFKNFRNENLIYCGISWISLNERLGKEKSIKPLSLLQPIFELEKLSFINLQHGMLDGELNQLRPDILNKINLYNFIDKFNDIDSLASLIDSCDLVITCSNSVAHISGAMGKKTFLLLPCAVGKFWYWHSQNNQSVWYPSVRIFQQKVDGDWTYPISELRKFLEDSFAK